MIHPPPPHVPLHRVMGHTSAPHYGVRLMRYRHPHGRIPRPPGQPDVYVIPPDDGTGSGTPVVTAQAQPVSY